MKGGKAPDMDQCAVEFLRKGGMSMARAIVQLGEFRRTGVGHVSSCSISERVTYASVVTPGE